MNKLILITALMMSLGIKSQNTVIQSALISTFTTKPVEPCQHHWGEPVIYTNVGTIAYGIVTINSSPAEVGDLVGVFVGDELRGVGKIVINSGTSYTTIVIQGTHIESLTFVIWDQSECQEVSVAFTTDSNPRQNIGYPPDFLPLQGLRAPPIVSHGDVRDFSLKTDNVLSNENIEKTGFTILPNPTRNILNITVAEKVNYRLFNIRGQVLKKGTLAKGKSKIDVSSLSKGIYLLNIKTNKGSFTKKIVRV